MVWPIRMQGGCVLEWRSDREIPTTMAARIEEASVSIDAAISSVLSNLSDIVSLKEHQRTALKAFVGGNDVFALLPTGFGKSLIYQMAPPLTASRVSFGVSG